MSADYKSQGRYDDSVILCRHIPAVAEKVVTIIKLLANVSTKKMFSTSDGQKFWKFISTKEKEFASEPEKIKMTKEFTVVVDNFIKPYLIIFQELDYVVQWLFLVRQHMIAIAKSGFQLDITWGTPATLEVLKIFNAYCKICFSFHGHGKELFDLWSYAKLSSFTSQIKKYYPLKFEHTFIDMMVLELQSSPITFINSQLKEIQDILTVLTKKVATVYTVLFASYSTFDWSIFSINCDDFLGEKPEQLSIPHFLLRNATTYVEAIRFFAVSFPNFVNDNSNFAQMVLNLLSENTVFHLLGGVSVELKPLVMGFVGHSIIPSLSSIIKDHEIKTKTTAGIRIAHLINLLSEYKEQYDISPSSLWMYMDELLALLGFASYTINCFIDVPGCQESFINLLGLIVSIYKIVEEHTHEMQRNYLFNLATQDADFIDHLLPIFERIGTHEVEMDILKAVARMNGALRSLDLEAFDNGQRFDYTGYLLTHGRIIHQSYHKDVSNFGPLLSQLVVISNHIQMAQSPVSVIAQTCPLPFSNAFRKFAESVKSSRSLSLSMMRTLLDAFRYVPETVMSKAMFTDCIGKYINMLLDSFKKMTHVTSRDIMIARQSNYDTTFKSIAFLVFYDPKDPSSYSTEIKISNRVSEAIMNVHTMPAKMYHGTTAYEIKANFKEQFLKHVEETLSDTVPNPLLFNSALNVFIQTMRPVFNDIHEEVVAVLLRSLRKQMAFHVKTLSEKAKALSDDARTNTDRSRILESSGYAKFFVELVGEFMVANHKKSTYEPFGLRFVGDYSSIHPFEMIIAEGPISELLLSFGFNVSLATMAESNKHSIDFLKQINGVYGDMRSSIRSWREEFMRSHTIPEAVFEQNSIRNAANSLMNLGVATTIRGMVKNSARAVLSDFYPGFGDAIQAAVTRIGPNMQPADAIFAETVGVAQNNFFLLERARNVYKQSIDMSEFFFFLALLFANPEWEALQFDLENDIFSPNVNMLPVAIGTILQLKSGLFRDFSKAATEDALREFFTVLASVAEVKKQRAPASYNPFIILIDHFPYFIKNLEYGLIEHAFPFTLIRSAYNNLH